MPGSGDSRSPGNRGRATLGSVAARAGVSPQTVSNVLNAPHLVRSDTAERVRDAVRELGYRPHRAARQLRTRRSHVLGLRVEAAPGDGVFDRFLHALTDAAAERDYRIMLYTARGDEAEIAAYSELYDRWDLDGFVLTSTHPGDRRTSHLADRGIPCVTFGRPWDGSDHHPWVDVDGAAGTRAATDHLLAAGHRRIGFLGWPAGPGVGDDRMSGWQAALDAAEVPHGPVARCHNDLTEGRAAAAALLDAGPTALVCVSDVLGLAVLAELTERGLQAGTDVAVVGFDDTDVAQMAGLSSVHQPLVEVAGACVRLITRLIESPGGSVPPERELLTPTLVPRASSGAG
ncbi:MAG TPA: LacI family DNA-binding transcriptional regulator [Nakamurella sp.]|nr:LacI family DNA-binding transcriptional regulator [Nakamurella sp.]